MPFYEGIGLIAEKNAIVLDVGAAQTKVGYAGEFVPRAILETPSNLSELTRDKLYDALVDLVHRIYFTHLLVNPKDRRVVLIDHLLGEAGCHLYSYCVLGLSNNHFKCSVCPPRSGAHQGNIIQGVIPSL